MKHPKKVEKILEKIKNADFMSGDIRAFCEYKIDPNGDNDDYDNFERIYTIVQSSTDTLLYAFGELIKDKAITYLCVEEWDIYTDSYDINYKLHLYTYKHPCYTESFLCDDLYNVATEITAESHAKMIFEIENGDYDENGDYIGYSGSYEGFEGVTK
jgi:hypothetical protein